jgi:hypothetical protein
MVCQSHLQLMQSMIAESELAEMMWPKKKGAFFKLAGQNAFNSNRPQPFAGRGG